MYKTEKYRFAEKLKPCGGIRYNDIRIFRYNDIFFHADGIFSWELGEGVVVKRELLFK